MVIELDPGVQAHIQLTFSQEASEWLQWEVLSSLDNSTYDTVNYLGGNLAANGSISAIVTGVRYFKVCGFLIDSDGTPGEDDTTSTLTVRVSAETEA